ncbi:MAG: hypothetical protein EOP08_00230 [Proteobacteria bacterium]|nr:MAG: hypothetical protein EOP08_00230 [Pseudomonadota bacterium]
MKRALTAGFCLGLGVLACVVRDESTQITIAFASETAVPSELDDLTVKITDARGSVTYLNDYEVRDPAFFPTTLAVVPANDESFEGPIRVEVEGRGAKGAVRLQRSAILAYSKGRNLLLPMPLRMACVNFPDCGAGRTCRGGQCVDAIVGDTELRDFVETEVFARPGGACFDEAACLRGAARVDVSADCTFPMAGDGNVALVWEAAPTRLLLLTAGDAQEGWTRQSPERGQLSRGACVSLLDPETDVQKREVPDRALEVFVADACPEKTAAVPYCPAADGHSGIGAAH